jgi:hypothetical protein
MKFCHADCAISQPDPADAFAFPPPAAPVSALEASQLPNATTDSYRLDTSELVEDFEVHHSILREVPVAV